MWPLYILLASATCLCCSETKSFEVRKIRVWTVALPITSCVTWTGMSSFLGFHVCPSYGFWGRDNSLWPGASWRWANVCCSSPVSPSWRLGSCPRCDFLQDQPCPSDTSFATGTILLPPDGQHASYKCYYSIRHPEQTFVYRSLIKSNYLFMTTSVRQALNKCNYKITYRVIYSKNNEKARTREKY